MCKPIARYFGWCRNDAYSDTRWGRATVSRTASQFCPPRTETVTTVSGVHMQHTEYATAPTPYVAGTVVEE
ncbi:hypothetical protein GCM10023318_61420 [Nocardia callitridis]|uniref:Uncharacterized protein n=1 Tax=Nocardia callitridis TaxID=648753 RepID=A0ABP9L2G6_9NOCA